MYWFVARGQMTTTVSEGTREHGELRNNHGGLVATLYLLGSLDTARLFDSFLTRVNFSHSFNFSPSLHSSTHLCAFYTFPKMKTVLVSRIVEVPKGGA
jgi:hypothetical protein